jgi:hypothetical protein
MEYDFDRIIDRRNTDSVKWSEKILQNIFGNKESIPMWVADMDFMVAEPETRWNNSPNVRGSDVWRFSIASIMYLVKTTAVCAGHSIV